MENIDRKQLKTALFDLLSRSTTNHPDKDQLSIFYNNAVSSLLKAKNKTELENSTTEILKKIKSRSFSVIDFELNNIILGRAKLFYITVPFEDKLRNFYHRLNDLKDLDDGPRPIDLGFDDQPKFFYKKIFNFEDTRRKLDFSHILNNCDEGVKDNIVLELYSSKSNSVETIIKMLFVGFLLNNKNYKNVIRDFIVDLLSLELFFTTINVFSSKDFPELNDFCRNLVALCCLEDFSDRLIDLLNDRMANEELSIQLSKLILYIIFTVVKDSSKLLFKKIIEENIPLNDRSPYLQNLNHLKKETLFALSNPTESVENPQFKILLFCLFKFLFNATGISLLVFDSSRFAKFRSDVTNKENVILALYEEENAKPALVFDNETSTLLSKEFVRCSFSDFGEDNEDFVGWLKRERRQRRVSK